VTLTCDLVSRHCSVDHESILTSKSIHSFSKYRVHKFSNRRENGRTYGGRTNGQGVSVCQCEYRVHKFSNRRKNGRTYGGRPNGQGVSVCQCGQAYEFLFVFRLPSNYGYILYRFRDKARHWLKMRFILYLLLYITIPGIQEAQLSQRDRATLRVIVGRV